ncbi:MAG: septum site-determining protein MinC [Chromatiales bacterium]|jgi:septum site-determining protein MinC
MAIASQGTDTCSHSVELKADNFFLPTLHMSGLDLKAVDTYLSERVAKAPDFFRNTPIVMDITDLHDSVDGELSIAIGAIRGYGLVPIGIRGGSKAHQEQARLMDLAVFPKSRRRAAAPPATRALPTKIVDTPVRSGQRVYAQDSDLVLLAPVSSGAEVVADGHVHAYTAIRGRVLAGVKGDESARIFCKDLKAELVSIAGCYKVSEDLDPRFMGRLVSISLNGDALVFKKL